MDDYKQTEHPDEHTLDTAQQPETDSSGSEPSAAQDQTLPSTQESETVSELESPIPTDEGGRDESAKGEQDWQNQNNNERQNILGQQGPNNNDWQNAPNQQGPNGRWQNIPNQQGPNGGWQNMPNQQGPNGGWQNMPNQQGQNGRWQNPQNQPPGGWTPPMDGNGQTQDQAPWQQGQNRQNPNVPYPQSPYRQEPPSGNYYYQGQPSGNFYPQNRQPVQKPPANNMAVTSLALGIASLLICCCCFPIGFIIGFALGMGGLVLAILSKKGQPFSGFAIAGLILSILGICASLFFFGCYLLVANMMRDPQYSALFYEIFEQYYNNGR